MKFQAANHDHKSRRETREIQIGTKPKGRSAKESLQEISFLGDGGAGL